MDMGVVDMGVELDGERSELGYHLQPQALPFRGGLSPQNNRIQVMVGIPNDVLPVLSSSSAASDSWVRQNVSSYLIEGLVEVSEKRLIQATKEIVKDVEEKNGLKASMLFEYVSWFRYVAAGNEPFLTSYSGQFQEYVVPALLNLQQSLVKANLANFIKLVVPFNADAYESSPPS
ncbi:hypothetical protein RJ641_018652 [Dillenia turbinata]|uniref:Uncharacterized protein n=1 Tax=Dillenia turbinata TaxID=194707 RepID=A0AAN8UTR2_9MAGN